MLLAIAFDSNVLTFFLDANQIDAYDPGADPDPRLAAERVAAFRLFLYCRVYVVPTVAREAERIQDQSKRDEHLKWIWYHLEEVLERSIRMETGAEATQKYLAFHSGLDDCRAVAEADCCTEIDRFVTFDTRLRSNLHGRTERVLVQTPAECWTDLNVPRGASPRIVPAPGHPLEHVKWWRWD